MEQEGRMPQVTEDGRDAGDLHWDQGGLATRPSRWSQAFTCKNTAKKYLK